MPELTPADVELATHGRLLADDAETVRALKRAYADVRKYCGWHVTPPKAEVVTLDGPDHPLLGLPTLALTTLTSVVEDGVTLNVSDLTPSSTGRLLVKKSGLRWSGKFRSIVVTMTHGFVTAPDFDAAVLAVLGQMSQNAEVGVGAPGKLTGLTVDDVGLRWADNTTAASVTAAALDLTSVLGLLSKYVLIPSI